MKWLARLRQEVDLALSSKDMVRVFRALSDPTRVEIVQLVSKSPRNVTELTSLVGVSQPKVSRHLKILRDAGLLNDVRRGKWVWYEMTRQSAGEPESAIATAMSMFFHGGAIVGTPARKPAENPARKPAEKPARKSGPEPVPLQKASRKPAQKRAGKPRPKPAPKEAPAPRPVAPRAPSPRTPSKDLEDFLL